MNHIFKTTANSFSKVLAVLVLSALDFSLAFAQAPTPQPIFVELKNPLKVNTIEELLVALLGVVTVIAIPIIVFFIIYSGFLYVTAQGNPEQLKQATRSLTYAIIGGVIVLGSVAIATIVGNLAGAFTTP